MNPVQCLGDGASGLVCGVARDSTANAYVVALWSLCCGKPLRPVTEGRVIAGRETVAVAQCSACGSHHRLAVRLDQFAVDTRVAGWDRSRRHHRAATA